VIFVEKPSEKNALPENKNLWK